MDLSPVAVARKIEHTMLDQSAPMDYIQEAAGTAIKYHARTCVVRPQHVGWIIGALKKSDVWPCAVIGFRRFHLKQTPHMTSSELYARFDIGIEEKEQEISGVLKILELEEYSGVIEFDLALNLLNFMRGQPKALEKEMKQLVHFCKQKAEATGRKIITKVIAENGLLEYPEKLQLWTWAKEARADYVKTCTGYTAKEATVEDVKLMKEFLGSSVKVKASGGVTQFNYREFLQAGADRIGTSKGMEILEDCLQREP